MKYIFYIIVFIILTPIIVASLFCAFYIVCMSWYFVYQLLTTGVIRL